MSSDDDDELAALRAQRAARTGAPATMSQLRTMQRGQEAAAAAADQYFERPPREAPAPVQQASQHHGPPRPPSQQHGPPRPPAQQQQHGPPRPPSQQQQQAHCPPRPPVAGRAQQPAAGADRDEEREGEDEDEEGEDAARPGGASAGDEDEERMDEGIRGFLPMAFGAQEKKVARPVDVHGAFRRAAVPSGAVGAAAAPGAAAAGGAGSRKRAGSEGPAGSSGAGEDGDMVGPPRPPDGGSGSGDDDDEEGANPIAGMDEEEEDDPYNLPVTHEAILRGHERAVTCLSLEHSGSRLASGSLDYTVRLYDFNGMKADMKPFRDLEPSEGHPVLSVSWSPTGDAFLVVTGSAQAKMYDRDGRALGEFVRGDMYIRDARNTKGHISGLTAGHWHPTDRFTAMTSSEDGTVRIWDTHNISQKTVIKPTLAKPGRVSVTTCAYNSTGTLIGAGLADGTIQVWSVGGKFGVSAAVGNVLPPAPQMVEKQGWSYVSRPNQLIRDAHPPGTDITCLTFSSDNTTMLSRSADETLKIWDLRKFQKPLHVHANLPSAYSTTQVIFSPDESLILTPVAAPPPSASSTADASSQGALLFFDRAKNQLVRRLAIPGNATAVAWHKRLNQIFVGTGNRKVGETRALYDTTLSERGVILAAGRQPRKASAFDFQPPLLIKTPHALPMYREPHPSKKRKDEKDAAKSRKPDPGMSAGMGRQGRVGTSSAALLTQHLLKQRGMVAPEHEMDPREAILRHADKAKDEFAAWTAAYKTTQPAPMFAQDEEDEEDAG